MFVATNPFLRSAVLNSVAPGIGLGRVEAGWVASQAEVVVDNTLLAALVHLSPTAVPT
jgi:hypothetical protein